MAGGGGFIAACGNPTPGPGSAAVLLTRVSGARLGGGEISLHSSKPLAQAGTRIGDGGHGLRALAALGNPSRSARRRRALSDVWSGGPSSVRSGVLSGVLSGVWSGVLSGVRSSVLTGVLSGVLSGCQSGVPSGVPGSLLSGDVSGGVSAELGGL